MLFKICPALPRRPLTLVPTHFLTGPARPHVSLPPPPRHDPLKSPFTSQMPGDSPEPGVGTWWSTVLLPPLWGLSTLCCPVPQMPTMQATALPRHAPRDLAQSPGTVTRPLCNTSSLMADLGAWAERADQGCATPAPSVPPLPPPRKGAQSQGHQSVAAQAGLSQRVSKERRRLISLPGWRRPGLGGRGSLVTGHPLPWREVETRSQAPHSVDSLPTQGKPTPHRVLDHQKGRSQGGESDPTEEAGPCLD